MRKLSVCSFVAFGLGVIGLMLRVSQILFFVDNITCLPEQKSFSYYAFAGVLIAAALGTVALLIILKNGDFIAMGDSNYGIEKKLSSSFAIASALVLTVYSIFWGGGFFNGSLVIKIGYAFFTLLYCAFFGFLLAVGEKFASHRLTPVFSIAPVMYYLFRLILTFLYYTGHDRDFNFKEVILVDIAMALFFISFARHTSGGGYSKRSFVFGLFAVFSTAVTWLPPLFTVRSAPAFGNDTLSLLFHAVCDIGAALFVITVIRAYLVDEKTNAGYLEKQKKKEKKTAKKENPGQ